MWKLTLAHDVLFLGSAAGTVMWNSNVRGLAGNLSDLAVAQYDMLSV